MSYNDPRRSISSGTGPETQRNEKADPAEWPNPSGSSAMHGDAKRQAPKILLGEQFAFSEPNFCRPLTRSTGSVAATGTGRGQAADGIFKPRHTGAARLEDPETA
ncbi:hypothetical protein ACIRSS_09585 [Amycolatopsis sp. NPDC101161]|uniref:hypothetical protein n=1 Tax=Amycolatopsis sp. NPDC101161 TaxID=3363940 RepID=UPI00382190F3